MKRIIDKSRALAVERILFPSKEVKNSKTSILRYMRFREKQNWTNAIEDIAYTYISDLRVNEDVLLGGFSKTIRYEVKRAQNENILVNFFVKQDLLDSNVLLAFEEAYIKFCKESGNKQLVRTYNRKLLKQYIKDECLLITKAEFFNGEIYHVYFYDDYNACLWFSVSNFRQNGVDRNLAARANKYLHFEDMRYLKNMGINFYDWGNVSTKNNENPNGIDKFKASFNGNYAEVYSYTIGNTLIGKIALFFIRIYKRLKESR